MEGVKLAFLHGDDQTMMWMWMLRPLRFPVLRPHASGRGTSHRPDASHQSGLLHRARPKTFIVLDLASGEVESVTVE